MNRNGWFTRVHWTKNLLGKLVDKWEYNGSMQCFCVISTAEGTVIWTIELAFKVVVQVIHFIIIMSNKTIGWNWLIHKSLAGLAICWNVVVALANPSAYKIFSCDLSCLLLSKGISKASVLIIFPLHNVVIQDSIGLKCFWRPGFSCGS